jgi:hypothetical protein
MSLDMFYRDDIAHVIAGTTEAGRYVGAEDYAFRAGWLAALRSVALTFGVEVPLLADNNVVDSLAWLSMAPVVHAVALQRIAERTT